MIDYLIVGNSAAAVGAVEAIRQTDKNRRIAIVSNERHPLYSRPLITYLLAGQVDEGKMSYGGPGFYGKYDVEEILGKEVVEVNPTSNEVVLDDGTTLSYQKLLLATGGRPIIPKVDGGKLAGVFTFTTWDDAERVRGFIEENGVSSAVVVGGGLIGLKTAEALITRGIRVTIVELADRVLSATFDRKASQIVETALREKGCSLVTKNTVTRVVGEGKVEGVTLQDGSKVDCQLVIFAIGVAPNTGLAESAGVDVCRGILVDDHMRTNIQDIYAAGDVVEARDLLMGTDRQIAIWPNAYVQGKVAGHNMAGKDEVYEGSFAMNSVEICGVPTISIGLTDPQERGYEVLEFHDEAKRVYRKIVLKDDIVVGAIFVNKIDRAGVFTGLIKNRVDVRLFKDALLREDFGLVWLPESFRKHMVVGDGIEV